MNAMYYVVIGKDKADASLRLEQRAAHLEFVEGQQGKMVFGGPILEDGQMVGSIFIFDVPDRATLDAYIAADPYFTRPIFESVEIYESRWMVPEREPGILAAEAEKARAAAGG